MNTGEEKEFLRLVESVLDGEPVDWAAERFSDDALNRRLGHLRFLEQMAVSNRGQTSEESASPVPQLAPGAKWGPLEVTERIGVGKESEVYRSFDPALRREVALKIYRGRAPEAGTEDQVLGEARRLARIRHPNVLFVHGVSIHEDRVGMWTDLIQGRTLEACLLEQGPQSPREVALVGMDLCRALAAVHAAGLVHRDVKTTNVMREHGGRIVLMDFGIGIDGASHGATSAGSPLYMAPELVRGGLASAASDLYSLGVVLFRLVTGAHPYQAETLDDLGRMQEREERRRLLELRPDLPSAFAHAVEKALAPRPDQRYASAAEMEAALRSTLEASDNGHDASATAAQDGIAPGTRKPGIRGRRLALLGIGLGVLAAAFLWWPGSSPKDLSVDATLYRRGSNGDESLSSGDHVHPGDRLYLKVQSSRPIHLYVLDEDEMGRAFLLFPIQGLDITNPLSAGTLHHLPGTLDGGHQSWEVDTEGGRESLVLVASVEPLGELEEALSEYPTPRTEPSGVETKGNSPRLRGIGRLVNEPGAPPDPARSRVADLLDRFRTEENDTERLWIRRIELQNPAS